MKAETALARRASGGRRAVVGRALALLDLATPGQSCADARAQAVAPRLLLTLDQLLHVLDAAGSNVSGGAEHDAVQELNVRLEVVAVGVALPVEVDLDLGCGDGWDEVFVLLDQSFQSESKR